jgi:hypothetical protein
LLHRNSEVKGEIVMNLGSLFGLNAKEFEWGVAGAAAGTIVSA